MYLPAVRKTLSKWQRFESTPHHIIHRMRKELTPEHITSRACRSQMYFPVRVLYSAQTVDDERMMEDAADQFGE